jgi:hypothetical protein
VNRLVALALVVSLTARAQEVDVIEVREARIATPANEILDVQGGIYLSPSGSASVAKKIVVQEAEIKSLKEKEMSPTLVVVIAVVGALGAGLGGFFAGKAAAK